MTFDNIPTNLEREIEHYAQAQCISLEEALVKLVEAGIRGEGRRIPAKSPSDSDWAKLSDLDPGYAFFEKQPEELLGRIEKSSKRVRSERLGPRA